MYKLLAIFALASAATANLLSPISNTLVPATEPNLLSRQTSSTQNTTIESFTDELPSACVTTCNSTVAILPACIDGDLYGCLAFCQQEAYDGFIDCVNCQFREDDKEYTQQEASTVQRQKTSIDNGCRARGLSVQTRPIEIPTQTASTPPSQTSTAQPSGAGGSGSTPNAGVAVKAQVGAVLGAVLLAVWSI